jgi:hypothetical protein
LYIIVKIIVTVVSFWRRYPLPAIIVLVMIVGGVFALASGTLAIPWPSSVAASVSGGPVEGRLAVETYLTGQQKFNAALMWEAMSDEFKAAMQQRGQTQASIQQQMERAKSQGLAYNSFQYVGGTGLKDGRSVHLYVVSATVPTQQGTRSDQQVPYTFTLDTAGKILNID